MRHKPRFVSERVAPDAGAFDITAMARGEPSVPKAFTWREHRYEVARTLDSRRTMGEDRGDSYVRRHYYDVETTDALRMSLYFERNPSDRGKRKDWWLYTLTLPDPVIETARLWLRRWTHADRDGFRLMTADPKVMSFLPDNAPLSASRSDEALKRTIQRYDVGFGDWAIEDRPSGEVIGESGLTVLGDAGKSRSAGCYARSSGAMGSHLRRRRPSGTTRLPPPGSIAGRAHRSSQRAFHPPRT